MKDDPQIQFDWLIGHAFPWLRIEEVAASCRCSDDHVQNWIADGSLDFVIDIKTTDAVRPCYRIFRPSFDRLLRIRAHGKQPETKFDEAIKPYVTTMHDVLASWQVARHLRCTDRHVRNLGPDIALDLASAASKQSYPRTHRDHLFTFIKNRRVS